MSTTITSLTEPANFEDHKATVDTPLTGNGHEDIAAMTEHLADSLKKPDVKEQLINDLRGLSKAIAESKAGFMQIYNSFIAFDNAGLKDRDNNALQLGPRWLEYFERFEQTIEQSRANAAAASAFLKQYSDAILTDVDQASIGDLRAELQTFVEKLEQRDAEALQSQKHLAGLASDLKLFERVVEEALRNADERITDEQFARYLQSAMHTAKREIEGLAGKIDAIAGVSYFVKSDMLALKTQLDQVVDSDVLITGRFLRKIAATRELYTVVATLLDTFAKGLEG